MILLEIVTAFFSYLPCHFKWYRKFKGGIWRYVICKYPAPINGCWIHNEEPYKSECVNKEENYV